MEWNQNTRNYIGMYNLVTKNKFKKKRMKHTCSIELYVSILVLWSDRYLKYYIQVYKHSRIGCDNTKNKYPRIIKTHR